MSLTEKALWNHVKGLLPGVADRVENAAGTGFPDVYGDAEGRSYWVELKVAPRTRSKSLGDVIKLLRPSQVVWAWRHGRAGAKIFLLVGHPKEINLYRIAYSQGSVAVQFIFFVTRPLCTKNKLYFIAEMRKALEHG